MGKKKHRLPVSVGRLRQDGVVASGMEAENDLGARVAFDSVALGANGTPADLERGVYAPNMGPPPSGADSGTKRRKHSKKASSLRAANKQLDAGIADYLRYVVMG